MAEIADRTERKPVTAKIAVGTIWGWCPKCHRRIWAKLCPDGKCTTCGTKLARRN